MKPPATAMPICPLSPGKRAEIKRFTHQAQALGIKKIENLLEKRTVFYAEEQLKRYQQESPLKNYFIEHYRHTYEKYKEKTLVPKLRHALSHSFNGIIQPDGIVAFKSNALKEALLKCVLGTGKPEAIKRLLEEEYQRELKDYQKNSLKLAAEQQLTSINQTALEQKEKELKEQGKSERYIRKQLRTLEKKQQDSYLRHLKRCQNTCLAEHKKWLDQHYGTMQGFMREATVPEWDIDIRNHFANTLQRLLEGMVEQLNAASKEQVNYQLLSGELLDAKEKALQMKKMKQHYQIAQERLSTENEKKIQEIRHYKKAALTEAVKDGLLKDEHLASIRQEYDSQLMEQKNAYEKQLALAKAKYEQDRKRIKEGEVTLQIGSFTEEKAHHMEHLLRSSLLTEDRKAGTALAIESTYREGGWVIDVQSDNLLFVLERLQEKRLFKAALKENVAVKHATKEGKNEELQEKIQEAVLIKKLSPSALSQRKDSGGLFLFTKRESSGRHLRENTAQLMM